MAAEDRSLMVGQVDDKVFIKVIGRGTAANSQSMKEFIGHMMDNQNNNFTIDLEKCTIVDSTFIGTLLAVNKQLEEKGYQNALEIVNVSSANVRTLEMIGVTKFIPVLKKGEKNFFNLEYLKNREFNRLESVQHVYDAHELLGRLSEENKARFKYVSQFMKEELDRLKGSEGNEGIRQGD